ncbi:MAG: AAA family ATPase [Chitinophagales bacterium]|jgi:MoxR-like ATPase|nr:MoxR family ATPase [Sphingobacteriales bacterium]
MANNATDIRELNEIVNRESLFIEVIERELSKKIIGQRDMIDKILLALLSHGHILLEGMPGLAKTLTIKSLSDSLKCTFNRIQFTPDLLPADIVGTMIYNQKLGEFQVKKGPVFANFLLADEINRAPSKVQSALLEAMQEKQVTLGDQSYRLDEPFLVMATQNPLEQEGTYPLPEAQLDRFMMKIIVKYPSKKEEIEILKQNSSDYRSIIEPVVDKMAIIKAKEIVKQIYMDEKIEQYIIDIVFASRFPAENKLDKLKHLISYGGSPRASINLAMAAKANAFMKRRGYVIPEDVRNVCYDVLRHRIGLTYEAEAENITTDDIITELLNSVEVP